MTKGEKQKAAILLGIVQKTKKEYEAASYVLTELLKLNDGFTDLTIENHAEISDYIIKESKAYNNFLKAKNDYSIFIATLE